MGSEGMERGAFYLGSTLLGDLKVTEFRYSERNPKERTVWSIARGGNMGRDTGSVWAAAKDGWRGILCTEMDPSPVVETVGAMQASVENGKARRPGCSQPLGLPRSSPCPFLHPLPSSAWPSVPFPGQLSRAGGLLAPGGNLLQVFTVVGTQGDRKSGRVLTRDTEAKEGRGLDV